MGGRQIARRHGLILGGKKVPIDKPRARYRDDRGEVLLETYEPILAVLDGSKALAGAVQQGRGERALIQSAAVD